MNLHKTEKDYQSLLDQISNVYLDGRKKTVSAVNSFLVETYWQIGRYIVEFEQDGNAKAKYGASLIDNLSDDLKSLEKDLAEVMLFICGSSISNFQKVRSLLTF